MDQVSYQGSDGWPLHATRVGSGPLLVLLHGGGPDHRSLLPLARRLSDSRTVVLPDVRGYGRSVCPDPVLHTWTQYADDVTALLDHLDAPHTALGGTGLGSTITLRTAIAHPSRLSAAILISVEDIEDDQAKEVETAMMDEFATKVRTEGIEVAWEPFMKMLSPFIQNLVREAIPRSDPASIAAAAAIGRDRAFRSVLELAAVTAPTLVFPGIDERHPTALAEELVRVLPDGRLAAQALSSDLRTADDLADAVAPAIRQFLAEIP